MSIVDKEFIDIYLESIDSVPEDEIINVSWPTEVDYAHNKKIYDKIKDDFKIISVYRSGKNIFKKLTANRDFRVDEAALVASQNNMMAASPGITEDGKFVKYDVILPANTVVEIKLDERLGLKYKVLYFSNIFVIFK